VGVCDLNEECILLYTADTLQYSIAASSTFKIIASHGKETEKTPDSPEHLAILKKKEQRDI
jgi:hypothetical protein